MVAVIQKGHLFVLYPGQPDFLSQRMMIVLVTDGAVEVSEADLTIEGTARTLADRIDAIRSRSHVDAPKLEL